MPTFDFICESCNYKMERFVPISSPRKTVCPQCKEKTFIRCIGAGAGMIFKGSGFYANDYKKNDDARKENNKMNDERNNRAKADEDY